MTFDHEQDRCTIYLRIYLYTVACLLSEVIKFKSCFIFYDLGFVAHNLMQARNFKLSGLYNLLLHFTHGKHKLLWDFVLTFCFNLGAQNIFKNISHIF